MKSLPYFLRSGRFRMIAVVTLAVIGFVLRDRWWPALETGVQRTIAGFRVSPAVDGHHDSGAVGQAPDEHAHDHSAAHEGHGEDVLELSAQAQRNLGLTDEYLQPVKLSTFQRSITVPGIIVERPGRTRDEVSTPMAGVVTHIHAVQGEAVQPGTLLFELRITAEELVTTQTELLKTIGELDVENREIARLTRAAESGAVSQKTLLDRQYAKDKLEVLLNAQREALRLHGLSERQIEDIKTHRRLLRDLRIVAPTHGPHDSEELRLSGKNTIPVSVRSTEGTLQENEPSDPKATPAPLILQEVLVHKGETVSEGATLGVLADYSELYIEGRAFEHDVSLLSESAAKGWKVSAKFDRVGQPPLIVRDLELVYSASEIDAGSRTLSFFVRLQNQIARESPSPNGYRFLEWRYRPGRRLQLQVPVEEWRDQIVVPVDAVAREGAESFVFQQNGDHFERVSVHVKFRDPAQVVIANDGSLFPGDVIALRGAHQMQMALRNKSGGGVDPHAGHTH